MVNYCTEMGMCTEDVTMCITLFRHSTTNTQSCVQSIRKISLLGEIEARLWYVGAWWCVHVCTFFSRVCSKIHIIASYRG